jgi:hypothetical protein
VVLWAVAAGVAGAQVQQPVKGAATADELKALNFLKGTLTLRSYVAEVREQWKFANIVVDTAIKDFPLPPADLKRVTLKGALQWVPGTREAKQNGLVLQIYESAKDGDVFFFTTSLSPAAIARADVGRYVQSWGVPAFIPGDSVKKILGAIQDDLNKMRSTEPGKATWIDSTRRIQVVGGRDDIVVAERAMNDYVSARRLTVAVEGLQTRVSDLRREVDSIKKASKSPQK